MNLKREYYILIFIIIFPFLIESCPCKDTNLCKPINRTGDEIFVFVLKCDRNVWSQFDWTKLTTIVLVNFYDSELYCWAHQHNVRVVKLVDFPVSKLNDDKTVTQWIKTELEYAKSNYLDGVNIDIEDPIEENSTLVNALTKFTSRVTHEFHNSIPHSQVTFDVPWTPYNAIGKGVDGRNYDFAGLAKSCDFLFVMSYDEQSQMFTDECVARANSDLYLTSGGLMEYLKIGVEPKKLVLGLPWYGYAYNCTSTGEHDKCFIPYVPFRGVNCSDAAGQQIPYRDIAKITDISTLLLTNWDEHSQTRYLYFRNATTDIMRQIWYDDPSSLSVKITFVKYNNLRGVGIWAANFLDYSGSKSGKLQVTQMWETFPKYR